uniref:Uncharacterized protein n=1 Tax=Pseudomonas phage vB_PaeS_HTN2 TaxID=3236647 RepID=A0AB39AI74_9VIRU
MMKFQCYRMPLLEPETGDAFKIDLPMGYVIRDLIMDRQGTLTIVGEYPLKQERKVERTLALAGIGAEIDDRYKFLMTAVQDGEVIGAWYEQLSDQNPVDQFIALVSTPYGD